jgi:N-methylhydantoinase A
VTDANVVLGFINPEALAGGTFPIRRELAEMALRTAVASPLQISVEDAAWGVHRVADAMMARALRAVSTERGRDPRDFAILAFGGNGPVHAATLASLLEVRRILVPPVPGVFSALGMLFPDVEHHYVRTFKQPLSGLDRGALETAYHGLEVDGAAALRDEGFPDAQQAVERLIDLRYSGANSELTLPLQADLRAAFATAHERQYGYRSDEEEIETMNIRVIARGTSPDRRIPERLRFAADATPTASSRRVYFGPERGGCETPVVGRSGLGSGWREGPILVEEYDSTTVVPPGARVRRSAWDTIEVELS